MSSVSGFEVVGPLAPFGSGFGAELVWLGYRPRSAGEQLCLLADASEWLAGHGLLPCDLTEVRVAELMVARRAAGRAHLLSVWAMVPLLGYLRRLGIVPVAVAATSVTPSAVLIERYSAYLLERRDCRDRRCATMSASLACSCPGAG
jgi:integrase/recombinase XerD